jgi:Family of unknown function (DUF6084)
MPDLNFSVLGAEAVQYAAVPMIGFRLGVTSRDSQETIYTVALRCQIQLDVARRHYSAEEQADLKDLFGTPDRWGQTLKSMLWTHASVVVPEFTGSTEVQIQVPCTFDFNVAATKYFHGLNAGDLPLNFLFSGTAFYRDAEGAVQVAPISWDKESRFRLPLAAWREVMDLFYPNTAWMCLRRDVFERLYRLKVEQGITSWEQLLEELLAAQDEAVRS